MTISYTDNPANISEIMPFVIAEKGKITSKIYEKNRCFFYDTCSFRRHSNLDGAQAEYFLKYIKNQDGLVVITRCILMELASYSGILNKEYIEYIKHMSAFGIDILLVYEEDLFSVMEVCFATNVTINDYLCWAVKAVKTPVSTITNTLENNENIFNEIILGKRLDNSQVFKRFFQAVRENKEVADNLGEEIIAICLYLLVHIPGEDDGKFSIITDDKGAAGRIDAIFKKLDKRFGGKDIGIFSTPKLVQILYREKILQKREHIKDILEAGTDGNITVLGMLIYDMRGKEISLSKDELAELIMKPNGINILF